MAQLELNLITAASMGDLEAVKRLMKLEPPGASQRQVMVFAALRDHAECLEVLIPICDQRAIDDGFAVAIDNFNTASARVLVPHISCERLLRQSFMCAVQQDDCALFRIVFERCTVLQLWSNADINRAEMVEIIERNNLSSLHSTKFWSWFYENDSLRQKQILEENVGGGVPSLGRKI